MSVSTEKKLLSVRETAKALGVSEKTVWTITAPRGPLACCRIGARVMYSPQAIDRYIEQQEGNDSHEKK